MFGRPSESCCSERGSWRSVWGNWKEKWSDEGDGGNIRKTYWGKVAWILLSLVGIFVRFGFLWAKHLQSSLGPTKHTKITHLASLATFDCRLGLSATIHNQNHFHLSSSLKRPIVTCYAIATPERFSIARQSHLGGTKHRMIFLGTEGSMRDLSGVSERPTFFSRFVESEEGEAGPAS